MTAKKASTRYLTKRHIKTASRKGFEVASKKAMETVGSVVVVEGRKVVRKYADGKVEVIDTLERSPKAKVKSTVNKLAFS